MTVLMVAAALYGVIQMFVLSWPARSVRLSTVLLALLAGVYACGTVAALLELTYTRMIAAATGESLIRVVNATAYTTAPWVEELVKASPLLLAGLYAKVRRQWGLTDFTVLGAALGAGFGLLEALLRYSLDADRAFERHGGWLVPDSLSPPYIPGPSQVFTTWLPSPAATLDLAPGGGVTIATFTHLAWTALAGLGVGILWRARTWWKPLALIPFGVATAHHTLNNYAGSNPGGSTSTRDWLQTLDANIWAAPVAALLLAMALDTTVLHRAKRRLPDTLLSTERRDGDTAAALIRYAAWRIPWTPLIALRFIRLRRALCYATPGTPPQALEPLRRAVAAIATRIDATDNERVWRTPDIRAQLKAFRAAEGRGHHSRLRLLLQILIPCVLVLPSVLFLGVGSFKRTAGLQEDFTTGIGPTILLVFAVAALAWIGWQSTYLLRTWRQTTLHPIGEQLATHRLRLASSLTALTVGTLLLWRTAESSDPSAPAIPTTHLLEALDNFLTYLGFALLLLSLLALFPPGGGLALVGGGAVGVVTLEAALNAAVLGTAGVVLMAVTPGGETGGAQQSRAGRSGEGEGGKRRDGSIDESEKQFRPKERRIAETLQREGKDVKALKESEVPGQKTADAIVDGVPTEFKTLDSGAAPNSVKNTLNTAKKQARDAVVDARGSGLGEDGAREGLGKFLRNNPPGRMNSIRIIGDGYSIHWP
ncbi:PrsW family glutamic-type intramembrane protease [Streptomyces sp. GESEQ-35]|uniref:CdiA C-terminal domain-containing protein n=1 Tax=Streptomyces sp. GESEQ-35 TaxID=2812657 RepID=UPI001B342258|nr:PrsW family glutamic-type intramembrane protease [Streptomyces sp. GESEQ-35]